MNDALELELRQLPGVCGVGVDDEDGRLVVTLCVEPQAELASVRHRAEPLARAHANGDVALVMIELGAAGPLGRIERVRLLGVQLPGAEMSGDRNAVEVHLSWRGRRTVGRATPSSIPSVVEATLDAVGAFGRAVPFHHRWSQEVGPSTGSHTVAVGVGGPERELYGMAAGVSREEAAARATLSALNRTLESGDPVPEPLMARG